ncbi:(2Fe-2S)-binding protein [Catelliglobosispora koreensis]|uniref:(2Fe-2S)-binding protein n=1 Tax=Catelliglobosispora koreensis TaxID=129052 RepID=UPI000364A822
MVKARWHGPVSTLVTSDTSAALRPLTVTLSAMGPQNGLASPLIVSDRLDWIQATELIDGTKLPALLSAARHRWGASAHAAATLAWKSYSYWVSMPAVLSWAAARRVPLMDAENVLVHINSGSPLLQAGLSSLSLAVLPDDPLASSGNSGIHVVPNEEDLLKALRVSLLDRHLDPLLDKIRDSVKLGRRTLAGSIASGVSYSLSRGGFGHTEITTVLEALDLSDLVDLTPAGIHRKTCCLAFTLPQPKICAGCCLRSC